MAFASNKIFYLGALVFISISAYILSSHEHGDSILWFADHRSVALNFFFTIVTKVGEEWSYFLLLFVLLCYKFRYALMVFVLAILVPGTSMSLKKFFSCPRPMKFFSDQGIFENIDIIDGVVLYAGNTSFPSGHTISAFAVLGFTSYVFSKHKWGSTTLIVLAISVAISRVYMVQHFLLDVCVGASIGCGIALITSWISIKIQSPKAPWLEKNLLNLKKEAPKA